MFNLNIDINESASKYDIICGQNIHHNSSLIIITCCFLIWK